MLPILTLLEFRLPGLEGDDCVGLISSYAERGGTWFRNAQPCSEEISADFATRPRRRIGTGRNLAHKLTVKSSEVYFSVAISLSYVGV